MEAGRGVGKGFAGKGSAKRAVCTEKIAEWSEAEWSNFNNHRGSEAAGGFADNVFT